MKKILFIVTLILMVGLSINTNAKAEIIKENKKTKINDNYSFKYNFIEKVKMGMSTIKIEVFDKKGKFVDDLTILGSYDMPSMRGHHNFPATKIQKNKKNEYLFPVNFVMRGVWEITLTFQKDDKEIYSGIIDTKI
jgi:uncharacterized protein YxeA